MMKLKNVFAGVALAALLAACGGGDGAGAPPPRSGSVLAAVSGVNSAADYHVVVQQLYVAYFGRPADSGGLANFEAALAAAGAPTSAAQLSSAYYSNATVRGLIDSFGNSAESTALYGGDSKAFVSAVYESIFNRAPQSTGLNYWSTAIDNGSLTKGNAALSILAGALNNTTAQGVIDAATARNKVLVSSNFTAALTAPAYVNGYQGQAAAAAARSLLGQVDDRTDVIAFQNLVAATLAQLSVSASLQPAALQWNLPTATRLALTDATGTAVSGTGVTCTAADPSALLVASNCGSIQALRLGAQQVLVSGPNVIATASVSVTPQHQVFGTNGLTGSVSGNPYNLLVTADGQVLAWGSNQYGVLGQGRSPQDLLQQAVPILVHNSDDSGTLGNIVAVTAGAADAMALTADGQVLAWGTGYVLAREAAGDLPSYVRNSTDSANLQHIVQLTLGQNNAAALAEDGTVYSWGIHNGQGSTISSLLPFQVLSPDRSGVLSNIVSIATGGDFTLALSADGKVYAWGGNVLGQLGRGTRTTEEVLPQVVQLLSDGSNLHNIVAIAAGFNFALALTADGQVYGWGDNSYGQIGQNLLQGNYAQAALVKNAAGTDALSGIKMISAGGWHALALDSTGKVYGWGRANSGQLGDGVARLAGAAVGLPQAVVSTSGSGQLSGVVALAAGYAHSMALATDGTVLIWGLGTSGNLGQGSSSSALSAVPLPVVSTTGTGKLVVSPLSSFLNLTQHGR